MFRSLPVLTFTLRKEQQSDKGLPIVNYSVLVGLLNRTNLPRRRIRPDP